MSLFPNLPLLGDPTHMGDPVMFQPPAPPQRSHLVTPLEPRGAAPHAPMAVSDREHLLQLIYALEGRVIQVEGTLIRRTWRDRWRRLQVWVRARAHAVYTRLKEE